MPWSPSDATKHTHRADTDKKRRQWAHVANAELKAHGDEGRAVRAANAAVGKALLFCDCVKDASVRSVHATTALGNSERKRRQRNDTNSWITQQEQAKIPDSSLKPNNFDDILTRKRRAKVTYPRASVSPFDFYGRWIDPDSQNIFDDQNFEDDTLEEEDEEEDTEKKWSIPLRIEKYQPDQQLVFGWASVVEKDGRAIIDKQGDIIPVEELENAAYQFTLDSRDGGDMHARRGVARLVESMVFTTEKQKALGVDLGQVGWWVGFKVHDQDLWAAHKRGERPEFSIGGAAVPVEVIEKKARGKRLARYPFDRGAAGGVFHVIHRLFAHQQHKLLREYSTHHMAKSADKVARIVAVLDHTDDLLHTSTRRLVDHITRAAQRTGQHAVDQLMDSPHVVAKDITAARAYQQQLVRDWEERTGNQALPPPMADSVDFWARAYGEGRAAELVGRMFDDQGRLVVKPDAEWNINRTTNEAAAQLVGQAIAEGWNVNQLADRLTESGLFSAQRAEMIARTEISRAQNNAMINVGMGMRERGDRVSKTWVVDGDPCSDCEAHDGETVSVEDEFEDGDEVPMHPNCMCEVHLMTGSHDLSAAETEAEPESLKIGVPDNRGRTKSLEVLKNPSTQEIKDFIRENPSSSVRVLRDSAGNFYAFDAYSATHQDVASALGVNIRSGRWVQDSDQWSLRDGKLTAVQSIYSDPDDKQQQKEAERRGQALVREWMNAVPDKGK